MYVTTQSCLLLFDPRVLANNNRSRADLCLICPKSNVKGVPERFIGGSLWLHQLTVDPLPIPQPSPTCGRNYQDIDIEPTCADNKSFCVCL